MFCRVYGPHENPLQGIRLAVLCCLPIWLHVFGFKGLGVVVWDIEDYIREAQGQLGDSEVYRKLDDDPSDRLQQIISETLGAIKERGDIDDSTLDYLMVNNPKLGRFYLLPKIHKRLNSVPGRPVISNCGFLRRIFRNFLIISYNHWLKKLLILFIFFFYFILIYTQYPISITK